MEPSRQRTQRKLATVAAVLFWAGLFAVPFPAQLDQWGYWENGITESWWLSSGDFTRDDAVNAVARWNSIGQANANAPGVAWFGDYFQGSETHGTYVRWSPEAGFIIVPVNKCEARVIGITYGRVEASPSLVRFIPEFRKQPSRSHHHSTAHAPTELRFVPVEWRGERLLIAESEMESFGDYLAGLGRYNYSDFPYFWYTEFFTKQGGTKGEASGQTNAVNSEVRASTAGGAPVVPPGYERYLKKPIKAIIASVGRKTVRRKYSYENPDKSGAFYERASLTYVTVDAGASDGLKTGMFLNVSQPAGGDRVRIIRVSKSSSTGVIIRSLDEDGETFYDGESEKTLPLPKIAVGWKLTTSHF